MSIKPATVIFLAVLALGCSSTVVPTTSPTGPDGASQEPRALGQTPNEVEQRFADAGPSPSWRLVRVLGWSSQPVKGAGNVGHWGC